jgi:hypothetical protein
LPLVSLTLDGKKIASISGSASGSVDAGATGTIRVPLPMDILSKKLDILGVVGISVTGATVYIVGFTGTPDYVDVAVYNPGTAAATVTVSVTALVIGV